MGSTVYPQLETCMTHGREEQSCERIKGTQDSPQVTNYGARAGHSNPGSNGIDLEKEKI